MTTTEVAPAIRIAVDAELTQSYRTVSPFCSGSPVGATFAGFAKAYGNEFWNLDGSSELYALDGDHVVALTLPGQAGPLIAPFRWDLGSPGAGAKSFAVRQLPDGAVLVAVAMPGARVALARWQGVNFPGPVWESVALPQAGAERLSVDGVRFCAGADPAQVFLVALCHAVTPATSTVAPVFVALDVSQVDHAPVWVRFPHQMAVVEDWSAVVLDGSPGVYAAGVAEGGAGDGGVYAFGVSTPEGAPALVAEGRHGRLTPLSGGRGVCAITRNRTGSLVLLRRGHPVVLLDRYVGQFVTAAKGADELIYYALEARRWPGKSNAVDGNVYELVLSDADTGTPRVTAPTTLYSAQPLLRLLAARSESAAGSPGRDVVFSTPLGGLARLSRPGSAGVPWSTVAHPRPVHFSTDPGPPPVWVDPLDTFPSYRVRISLSGAAGLPATGARLVLNAERPVVVEINGALATLGVGPDWNGLASPTGSVDVVLPADRLGAPTLWLWAEGMIDSDRVEIRPAGRVHRRLGAAQGADLQDPGAVRADDGTTTAVLPAAIHTKQDAGELATAMRKLMAAAPQAGGSAAHPVLHATNVAEVATYVTGWTAQPQRQVVAARSEPWVIDFSGGAVVVRSPDGPEQQRIAARGEPASTLTDRSLGHALAHALGVIEDGFAKVSKVVVAATVEVHLLVDEVPYLIVAAVQHVESAFHLVTALLHHLADAAADLLFRWLGHVFDWADVLRTHDVLRHVFDEVLAFAQAALPLLAQDAHARVETARTALDEGFAAFRRLPATQTSTLATAAALCPAPAPATVVDARRASLVCPVQHAISHRIDHVVPTSPEEPVPAAAAARIDGFVGGAAHAVAGLLPPTPAAGTTPVLDLGHLLAVPSPATVPLPALMDKVHAVATVALGAAEAVLGLVAEAAEAVADAVHRAGNETIEIPVVSRLYADLTGGAELTPVGLVALSGSVAVTTLARITGGPAPFPDAASVAAAKAAVSADTFLVRSGLEPAAAGGPASRNAPELAHVLATLSFFNTAVFGVLDYGLDRYPPVPVPGIVGRVDGEAMLSRIVYAQAWLAFVATIPWIEESSGGFGVHDPKDIERTLWLLQIVGLAMDSFWMLKAYRDNAAAAAAAAAGGPGAPLLAAAPATSGRLGRNSGDLGTVLTGLWGAINLVGTVYWGAKDGWSHMAGVVEGIFANVPVLFKILRVSAIVEDTDGASLKALLVLDAIGDVVAAGASGYKAFFAGDDPPQPEPAGEPARRGPSARAVDRPGAAARRSQRR